VARCGSRALLGGWIAVTVVVATVGLAQAQTLGGDPWGGTQQQSAPVTSDGRSRVDVVMRLVNGEYVFDGVSEGGGGSGGSGCRLTVVVMPTLDAIPIATDVFEGATAVQIRCGTSVVDERWIGPGDVVDVDAEARAQAEQYVRSVLAPRLSMGVNPPANVLVGLPTWFWLDGWDGAPINVTVTAPWGETIDIELTLARVMWDFGDGSPSELGDLGEAFPSESSVEHVYTDRSTSRSSPDAAFSVTASVQINVRYWYDGGGPYAVAPLVHDHVEPVIVRQLQAVIG
jgi:hypothetical protein